MGCCGQKRQTWIEETKSSSTEKSNSIVLPEFETYRSRKTFENTKDRMIAIKGVATGKTYRFIRKGHRIKVDFMDSFAMKGENGLKMIKE